MHKKDSKEGTVSTMDMDMVEALRFRTIKNLTSNLTWLEPRHTNTDTVFRFDSFAVFIRNHTNIVMMSYLCKFKI